MRVTEASIRSGSYRQYGSVAGTLNVTIVKQRAPIARVLHRAVKATYYIDRQGVTMPLILADHTARVPLISQVLTNGAVDLEEIVGLIALRPFQTMLF